MYAPIPSLNILSSAGSGNCLEVRSGRGRREDKESRVFDVFKTLSWTICTSMLIREAARSQDLPLPSVYAQI